MLSTSRPSMIETLESRQLLSATIALHGNTLLVRGDEHSANDILIQRTPDDGTIQVDITSVNRPTNQVTTSTKSFPQAGIRRVIVQGGQLDDSIVVGRNDPDWHLSVFINAGKGNDDIATGGGDDLIVAGDGNDHVDSGAGNDHVLGGKGNDEISGDNGNDFLDGGDGDDVIHGGDGNDILRGGKGADTLVGDSGNDILLGQGGGHDTLTGGDGSDTFVIHGHEDASTDYDSTADLLLGQKTKGKESHVGKEAKDHARKD